MFALFWRSAERADRADRGWAEAFLLAAAASATLAVLLAEILRAFPCAIICTVCGGRTRLHGLDLAAQTGGMKLFVGEGFTWDEDG